MMAGGHLQSLLVPSEFVSLGGLTLGMVLIASNPAGIKGLIGAVLSVLKGGYVQKKDVEELLKLQYELFNTARSNGLIALEDHVMDPKKSAIFSKFPTLTNNHGRLEFLTNGLKPLIDGRIKPEQLESLMQVTMDAHDEELSEPIHLLQLIGDSLPGLGIIAAVLGIIHTMAIVDSGPQMVGKSVAAALTGTLMGILGAYGFINPTAAKVKHLNTLEYGYFVGLMKGLCGFAQGMNPIMAVEVARRCLDHHLTPSAEKLEEILKGAAK
jgi:chemotaxis protein MotA